MPLDIWNAGRGTIIIVLGQRARHARHFVQYLDAFNFSAILPAVLTWLREYEFPSYCNSLNSWNFGCSLWRLWQIFGSMSDANMVPIICLLAGNAYDNILSSLLCVTSFAYSEISHDCHCSFICWISWLQFVSLVVTPEILRCCIFRATCML